MISFLLTFVVMFVFWFLLSGQINTILLSLGVVSSLLVARWSHDLIFNQEDVPDFGRAFRFILYIPWLAREIVLANIHVLQLILNPQRIDPGIIRIKNELKTDWGIATVANSYTVTPGTVTIEGNRDEYIIHYLSKKTAEDLLNGETQARVQVIEGEVKEAKR